MKVHEFTIIASGLHPDADDLANLFFGAGCDDAVLSFQKGVIIAEFDREAPSFSSAVISACTDVLKTGANIERIEPDHLVSLADMAKRTGLSRSALTNYHQGERGENFPSPVARITSESPLWDWYEVATWLHGRERIGREIVVQARIVREANILIETHSLEADQFVTRMTERVMELEGCD
ncbi:MAG TPA: helix-turn-helix transcriptional regulator [Sphingomicrobium sp.]|nr:helix-turn-helix transcriptional regulator [Sphingomicrobium sp.]